MPRNGSGTYTPPSSSWYPAVDGQAAETDDWNSLASDLSDAISDSISADGQTPITANLPMSGFKFTGLAAGTDPQDSVRVDQIPAQYYFRANKNAVSQTGITDATATKVTLTNEVLDNGGYYDAANSKWTPPAGLVQITAAALYTGTLNDTGIAYVMIYKNGALISQGAPYRLSSTAAGNSITSIMDVADGDDYYEVYVYVEVSSGTSTVNGGVSATYFEGVWLG